MAHLYWCLCARSFRRDAQNWYMKSQSCSWIVFPECAYAKCDYTMETLLSTNNKRVSSLLGPTIQTFMKLWCEFSRSFNFDLWSSALYEIDFQHTCAWKKNISILVILLQCNTLTSNTSRQNAANSLY